VKKIAFMFFFVMSLGSHLCFAQSAVIQKEEISLFDDSRNRFVPIQIYQPDPRDSKDLPVVLINHGSSIRNTEYSFIACYLSSRGYRVVSIQHELVNDPPELSTGTLFERRKPLWERGVQNILFVISELHRIYPTEQSEKVILIGHSMGGDISMLFAAAYPECVAKVISLDSLRVPFPTKEHIPILSLRSNDMQADEGVLPESDASIIYLENAKHGDMCDRGPEEVKQEIAMFVGYFLTKK
jgi:peptidoglycan-N-acetylglucosamine deacetylase